MSQQCSWPTHSGPLEGRCPYYALLGLTQAPGFAGGPDWLNESHLGYDCKCSLLESPEKVLETLTSKQNRRKAPKRRKNGQGRGENAQGGLRCNHDRKRLALR